MFLVSCLFLIIAILSLWIHRSFWIWGSLLISSLVFAQLSKQLSSYGLIAIFLVIFLFWLLSKNITGLVRFGLAITALFFSATLFSCLAPGIPACFSFMNIQINYSKILVTLPLLGFCIPILSYRTMSSFFVTRYFLFSILGAFCVIGAGHFLCKNSFSLHFPSTFILSLFIYFICLIIPEESLFRGFLQKELLPWVGKGWIAHVAVCAISAGLSTVFHSIWISNLSFLALTFIASLVYATVYQVTKIIEVSIFCRFITSLLYYFVLSGKEFL